MKRTCGPYSSKHKNLLGDSTCESKSDNRKRDTSIVLLYASNHTCCSSRHTCIALHSESASAQIPRKQCVKLCYAISDSTHRSSPGTIRQTAI